MSLLFPTAWQVFSYCLVQRDSSFFTGLRSKALPEVVGQMQGTRTHAPDAATGEGCRLWISRSTRQHGCTRLPGKHRLIGRMSKKGVECSCCKQDSCSQTFQGSCTPVPALLPTHLHVYLSPLPVRPLQPKLVLQGLDHLQRLVHTWCTPYHHWD